MYYDASSTDYISTPSFAIPNTGILTVEAWMKSIFSTSRQVIFGDGSADIPTGFFRFYRVNNSNGLSYGYSDGGTARYPALGEFFTGLDNQ